MDMPKENSRLLIYEPLFGVNMAEYTDEMSDWRGVKNDTGEYHFRVKQDGETYGADPVWWAYLPEDPGI